MISLECHPTEGLVCALDDRDAIEAVTETPADPGSAAAAWVETASAACARFGKSELCWHVPYDSKLGPVPPRRPEPAASLEDLAQRWSVEAERLRLRDLDCDSFGAIELRRVARELREDLARVG